MESSAPFQGCIGLKKKETDQAACFDLLFYFLGENKLMWNCGSELVFFSLSIDIMLNNGIKLSDWVIFASNVRFIHPVS